MIRNDERWLALVDEFHAAAIDGSRWYPALEALAAATGSRSGQLIGIGSCATVPFNTVPFNIVTNLEPAALQAFDECGGGDPDVNPRVKAGSDAAILQVTAEADFLTNEEHERHPHYANFLWPWDIPFSCLTPLEKRDGLLVGLAVLRSQKEGHISDEQRRIFASVAPHVRSAVRTQLTLETQGASLLAGCIGALSMSVFICDARGRVQALTQSAAELVSENGGLQLKAGRLSASDPSQAAALSAAIAAATHSQTVVAKNSTVVVRVADSDIPPLVLDIVALPTLQYEFNFAPRVLVKARRRRETDEQRAAVLRAAYDLTAAEAEVALLLSAGKSPEAIAAIRCVAVGTIRAQIKTLLAKAGTNRAIELTARLNRL